MDVIHDPATDWCACEPDASSRCDYRLLADTVIERLNPPDRDEAEVAICVSAVERIAGYVASLPCRCGLVSEDASEPCPRCAALGQWRARRVDR